MFNVLPQTYPYFWIYGVNNPTQVQMLQQNQLLTYCLNSTESECKEELEKRCSNFTRADMSNLILRQFCSCNLPAVNYETRRECDVMCSEYDSVQNNYGVTCNQASCVIDNIVINGKPKNVNINQICPACLTGSCTCIINDVNLLGGSSIKNLNIAQTCGSDSKCRIRNNDGTREEIPCSSLRTQDVKKLNFKDCIVLFVLCCVLCMAIALIN